ncbi:MAG: hypothetical protein AB7P49_10955 [Bdellovibrionales bacterium]
MNPRKGSPKLTPGLARSLGTRLVYNPRSTSLLWSLPGSQVCCSRFRSQRQLRLSWLCLLLWLPFAVSAAELEVREDFSTRDRLESATAIWNQALGAIHPTLQVMNFMVGFTPRALDVGDGSDGAFEPSSYGTFSQNGDLSGNVIRLDLTEFPELKVTRFELAAGWRLEPIGNAPLVIRSLSDVLIRGEIWCQGHDGEDASGGTAGSGGEGRCGGARGGDGGEVGQSGTDGADSTAPVTGGQGGNFTGGAAVGGGGGGSWNTTSGPGNGANATGAGGSAGTSDDGSEFLTIAGGAGGAGGSGTGAAAGAGGGGGGGTVIVHAVRDFDLGEAPVSATGFIYVYGGVGGSSNTTGGPGGGGGGGSVQVFVGRTINIYNNDGGGASRADGGTAGTNAVPASGGLGGLGRSWFSSVNYNGIGFYTPAEDNITPGNVEFSASTQNVVLKGIDLASTRPTLLAIAPTPASADFTTEFAGSSDGFVSDDTGWTSDLGAIQNKRYVKLRLSITTSNVNTPTMLEAVSVNYTPFERDHFNFKAAGCGRVFHPDDNPSAGFWLALFLLLFTGVALKRNASSTTQTTGKPSRH